MHKLIALTLLISIFNINAQKTKLKIGDKIPNFTLYDQHGRLFNSHDHIEKQPLVIFFYPSNKSKVCTKQACSFRDNYSKFKKLNAKVVGINPDYLVNHSEFSVKNKLPYQILADKNNKVQKLFGVPSLFLSSKPKRYTFVIDKKGFIRNVYYNRRDVESHITHALKILNN